MRGPRASSAFPATRACPPPQPPQPPGKGSWRLPRRQGCVETGGCWASTAKPHTCLLGPLEGGSESDLGRGSLGKESLGPRCGRLPPCPSSSSTRLPLPSVGAPPSRSARLALTAACPPPSRRSGSPGAVLCADSWRSPWGFKGVAPDDRLWIYWAPGSTKPRPWSWGRAGPAPFPPGTGQIGQGRPRGWLLGVGGGVRLPNIPSYLGGTIPSPQAVHVSR